MTRTIDERIDVAIAEMLWKEQITSEEPVESILREQFSEPWLDKPDGPGHWWVREAGEQYDYVYRITDTSLGICQPKNGRQWQRVIGPSN